MHCFYHQDRESVGTCKSCGKGLCPDCAVDLGKGLACRDRCENDVRAVIALVDDNIQLGPAAKRMVRVGKSARWVAALFFLATGGLSLWYGISDSIHFIALIGAVFVVYGVIQFLGSRRA